jgi:hypothetical protein
MAVAPLRLGMAYLVIGLAPLAFAVRGVNETHAIGPASISHVAGASYIAPIHESPWAPLLVAASDDPANGRRSSARLFEDERELRPAHALHVGIAAVGKGRFSHWTTAVYLSASDNSDPRTNGRVYRLQTVARLPMTLAFGWALTLVLAGPLSRRFWVFDQARWLPSVRPTILAMLSAVAIAVLATAGPGAARFWALASWLVVGFVSAFCAAVVMSRVSAREFIRSVSAVNPAAVATAHAIGSIGRSLARRTFDSPGWRGRLIRAACMALPVAVFIATLRTAWPEWMLDRAYRGGGLVILATVPALWLAHARRGWLAGVLGLTVTGGLFALALAALWQDVAIHYNAIGGLLPFSDAQGYYFEANRLLDGHPLAWSARRPLFTAFLAVLLAGTGSLSVALAVMVALNAVTTFLFAREVRLSFGAAAATAATLILFAFYRRDGGAGAVLTENLGLLLGTAAFTALLRGVRLQDTRSYLSGAVVLTAALMARAGAFFVLPALVVVAFASLRGVGSSRTVNVRAGLATVGAIVIAAAACLVWGKALSTPAAGNTAFSNYSQSLYGLVVGGKGWTQIHVDHPDAREGAEIYALAYQAFRARPSGLVEGLAKMTRAYLWPSEPYHAFAFIQDDRRTEGLQRICYALAVIALGACVWKWRDPVHALLLALGAGHLASIPFVPPIDAGLRVYAATMPIPALLVAAGIAATAKLLSRFRGYRADKTTSPQVAAGMTSRLSESAALVLIVVVMGSSWTLFSSGRPTTLSRLSCSEGRESLLVPVDDDAIFRIHSDLGPRAISPTDIRQSEAQLSIGLVELKGEAPNLRAGMSLVFAYDLLDGRQVWLAGETGRLPRSGPVQICGHDAADALARRYGLIYIDEARPAGNQ